MCNEISRRANLATMFERFGQTPGLPPFEWRDGRIPNDLEGKASVRINDSSLIVRLEHGKLIGDMLPWAWKSPNGKPVFNFVSEGRDFSKSDRVLVFADGFYEFTTPERPKVKLKDKHLFELVGAPWFWVAGIVRDDAFTLLTARPGPDLEPYHDRQIVILPTARGADWLNLSLPANALLQPLEAGALKVTTLRRNGVSVRDPLLL